MSQYLVTVGRKNDLLTGRCLHQNQASIDIVWQVTEMITMFVHHVNTAWKCLIGNQRPALVDKGYVHTNIFHFCFKK